MDAWRQGGFDAVAELWATTRADGLRADSPTPGLHTVDGALAQGPGSHDVTSSGLFLIRASLLHGDWESATRCTYGAPFGWERTQGAPWSAKLGDRPGDGGVTLLPSSVS